jgi:hypothetical protein
MPHLGAIEGNGMVRARVSWPNAQSSPSLVLLSLLLTSCTALPSALLQPQTTFPPQKVIETGDYGTFLAENQRNLSACGGWIACDIVLFNLGFVHAYPQSPYRDPQKARWYLRELQRRFPQSPWASQGRVLLAFMNEQASLEEARRQLRTGLRSRDATIRKLREQLDLSREIDIEIDKKERELLR